MIAKSVACLDTLIFSYIRIGSGHFGDSSIRMGFQNNDFFWGMNILWIFLGGHHKIGLVLGVIFMYFRVGVFTGIIPNS